MINTNVLVGAACLCKKQRGGSRWFVVKQNDDEGWELPKVTARRGESSVRATLRMMGEQGGMSTKVIEEAGRAGGVTTVNGKTLPQRTLYYFMILKSSEGEAIGFGESAWLKYAQAVRKLGKKRERAMLKLARKEYKVWLKKRKKTEE